jgi:Lrp/AsnC family transcriptional regulator, leucine-responsive regulatory protein
MPISGLDVIDCRIIAALQADGRLTNLELADRVGLSPSPCLRRVKRLERDGYIAGYRAVLQRNRLGLGLTVFVGVRIGAHANVEADAFLDAVVKMAEVVACHLVSGEMDYLLEVVVPDLDHYQRFLVGKLLALPIVREVRSSIAIQTHKAGAPLPLDHLARPARLPEHHGNVLRRKKAGRAPESALGRRRAEKNR